MIRLLAKIRSKEEISAKEIRKKGLLPGIVYGPEIENSSLEIDKKEFEKVFKEAGESTLIDLEIEGMKNKMSVLIHEVQYHPITEDFIHVDLYQPLLGKEIEVNIPLVFEGESMAVKELNGVLVKDIHELEVKTLPRDIPHEIIVDISKLKTFNDIILIKDLDLPKGVKSVKDLQDAVVSVMPPKKEETDEPVEKESEEVKEEEKKEENQEGESKEE